MVNQLVQCALHLFHSRSSITSFNQEIKGIFDSRAEGEHRRRTSWPELLTAFLIVQPHDRSGGPRHVLPGIREGKNMSKGVHFLSILRGNVRQGYFPIIRWVWIMLRLVLIRMSFEGLCLGVED